MRGRGSRRRRDPAGPGQRAHAPRAVVDARPGAAGASMPAWAASLMALRRTASRSRRSRSSTRSARRARSGTCARRRHHQHASRPTSRCSTARSSAAMFRELLGFSPPDPDAVVRAAERADRGADAGRMAAAVDRRRTRRTRCRRRCCARSRGATGERPLSVHLGESAQEVEFLRDGTGAWRDAARIARRRGTRHGRRRAAGRSRISIGSGWSTNGCSPCTACSSPMRSWRAGCGAARRVVTCPRSNRWTGAGVPPIARFYASGVSRRDRHRQPGQRRGSQSVRRDGGDAAAGAVRPGPRASSTARRWPGPQALGFAAELGSIEPGKRAADHRRPACPPRRRGCGRISAAAASSRAMCAG